MTAYEIIVDAILPAKPVKRNLLKMEYGLVVKSRESILISQQQPTIVKKVFALLCFG